MCIAKSFILLKESTVGVSFVIRQYQAGDRTNSMLVSSEPVRRIWKRRFVDCFKVKSVNKHWEILRKLTNTNYALRKSPDPLSHPIKCQGIEFLERQNPIVFV
jgi:hypothetical protein